MITKQSLCISASLLSLVLFVSSCKTVTETASNTDDAKPASTQETESAPSVVEKTPITLNNVYFDFAKFNIRPDQVESLTSAAQQIKNSNMKVQLQGHTDDRGAAEFNLFLGENRASSVKQFLVTQGVSDENITIISFGKEKPAAFCPEMGCSSQSEQEDVWQKNRRVEFTPLN